MADRKGWIDDEIGFLIGNKEEQDKVFGKLEAEPASTTTPPDSLPTKEQLEEVARIAKQKEKDYIDSLVEPEVARCYRCNEVIVGIKWGIYQRKWCSIACKRADEVGGWI